MILATNNKGKLRENKEIFNDYEIYSLKEKGIFIEVDENQPDFEGNAKKKAKEIYEIAKEEVIADDSGLCISALNDFPGVLTHRYIGENATDEERNADLIKRLEGIEDRSAKIVCVMAYYDGKEFLIGKGVLNGKITTAPRGENGFGFDPIFEIDNEKTLAEIPLEEKNTLSARYLAALDLKQKIKNYKNK